MNRLRLLSLMDRLLGRLFELQQWQREQVEANHPSTLQDVNKQLQRLRHCPARAITASAKRHAASNHEPA